MTPGHYWKEMGKIALFSIKPCYFSSILSGEKQYEFRRSPCRSSLTKIVFYASAPVSSIIGEARTERTISGTPDTVWSIVQFKAGITREAFDLYFDRRTQAFAYRLTDVLSYDKEIPISCINAKPPQSFYYISNAQYSQILLMHTSNLQITRDN